MNHRSILSLCPLTLTASGYYQYFYPTSFRVKAATRFTICTVQLSQTLENKALICNWKNYLLCIKKVQKNILNHVCFWRPTASLRQFWCEAKVRLRTVVPWDGEKHSFGWL